MSDTITVKATQSESKFKTHDEGQFVGQCVDVINLGEKLEQYPDTPAKVVEKCALVFRTGEQNDAGEYIDLSREFTISMHERSGLRKFLEQWRGKPYTEDEIKKAGVPLHKLTGQYGLLTVAHKTSGNGKTYANIAACVGVPKQMQSNLPEFEGYARSEFWNKRKQEYAAAVQDFRAEHATGGNGGSPFADDGGDMLPF